VWDNLNRHKSAVIRALTSTRARLTVYYLPTTAPELNPVEGVWAVMKSGLVNLIKREIDQLHRLVKQRLRRMQYRPELLAGLLAKTGLDPLPP
jgi:transposase